MNQADFNDIKCSTVSALEKFEPSGQSVFERIKEKKFEDTLKADTNQCRSVVPGQKMKGQQIQSITSVYIGDCHTLFGVEKKMDQITKIFAYHYSQDTDPEEDLEPFLELMKEKDRSYIFYTAGGNLTPSTKDNSLKLLKEIIDIVKKVFTQNIEEALVNNEQSSEFPYITVNLTLEGQFTYFHHGK